MLTFIFNYNMKRYDWIKISPTFISDFSENGSEQIEEEYGKC